MYVLRVEWSKIEVACAVNVCGVIFSFLANMYIPSICYVIEGRTYRSIMYA